MVSFSERDVVFNIVWTGTVFDSLKYFVASQLDHCGARFRFVANGCSDEQVAAMQGFASRFPDRVVEVFVASSKMIGHGRALDAVLAARDDGELVGLIDPDIRVSGPFLGDFLSQLDDRCVAISSGRGVWLDDDHIPAGHPGVNGEYFYSTDGFLFGSPHFALYRRAPLDETLERWGIGFGSAGPNLPEATAKKLADEGHEYMIYDTGKLVNAFLQIDGHEMRHEEHDALMHIGGVSHYLEPGAYVVDDDGDRRPDWAQYESLESRFEVARYTAAVLTELIAGRPAPAIPDVAVADDHMGDRLMLVRDALIDLVARYRQVVAA